MNTVHTSLTNKQTSSASVSADRELREEELADLSAGFFPFVVVGVGAVVAGGAAALWGHKRAGLMNR